VERQAGKIPGKLDGKVYISEGEGDIHVQKWLFSRRVFEIRARTPVTVKVKTFWYPGWRASLNGNPWDVERDRKGLIKLRIPPGRNSVSLEFTDTLTRKIFKLLSLAAFITSIAYISIKTLIVKLAL